MSKQYQLVKTFSISCAHYIPGADKCGQLHGHNYQVTFCIEGKELDQSDMLIDFREIKHALVKRYDHQLLNHFPEFDREQGGVFPTAERIAEVCFQRIAQLCSQKENQPRLRWVEIRETAEAYARYGEI
ncbi:preQ(0) biosynthesis protein QueD [Seinonella peptonophila]|uniref:6-carboxy-5,6,7,8-tetrahydropterin synthase n=1 Tax=Seinonella peptonophila TaxID=112248 RepID=A0A1M4XIZ8_9BACL|nr:6-carboxytetrahydropterin synthase [Seinonella peptonophila]SHE93485.1 preQ(0) biosynthesis protein QueD [Seinonella peptonophila]